MAVNTDREHCGCFLACTDEKSTSNQISVVAPKKLRELGINCYSHKQGYKEDFQMLAGCAPMCTHAAYFPRSAQQQVTTISTTRSGKLAGYMASSIPQKQRKESFFLSVTSAWCTFFFLLTFAYVHGLQLLLSTNRTGASFQHWHASRGYSVTGRRLL